MKFDFEWAITEPLDRAGHPDERGNWVCVRERLVGSELSKLYGPMRKEVAESFVRARRNVASRIITRAGAMQIFEPRPDLEALAVLQGKGHYDS